MVMVSWWCIGGGEDTWCGSTVAARSDHASAGAWVGRGRDGRGICEEMCQCNLYLLG